MKKPRANSVIPTVFGLKRKDQWMEDFLVLAGKIGPKHFDTALYSQRGELAKAIALYKLNETRTVKGKKAEAGFIKTEENVIALLAGIERIDELREKFREVFQWGVWISGAKPHPCD